MKKVIKFDDIKPVGNFDSVLETLREKADAIIGRCHVEKKYNSAIANCIKLIVGELCILDVLKDGILKNEGWSVYEMKVCLLYAHLIIIDLNDVAQLYLNGINMPSRMLQLQEYADNEPEVFGEIKFE